MRYSVLILQALRNIKKNKKRSILTIFGIVIGIASVITIVSLGEAYKKEMISDITGNTDGRVVLNAMLISNYTLSGDMFNVIDKNIVENIEGVKSVQLEYAQNESEFISVNINGKSYDASVKLVTKTDYRNVLGRNLYVKDNDSLSRNIVVTEQFLKSDIKDINSIIGDIAIINDISYEIVGVVQSHSNETMIIEDVYIPEDVFKKYCSTYERISQMNITLNDNTDIEKMVNLINDELNKTGSRKMEGKYYVQNSSDIINLVGGLLSTLTYFIAMVAGISLIIATIGLMNMIYTSVSERTIEIGIKRALGAKQKDIEREFLIEGIVITVIGGILGYVIGILNSNIISIFMSTIVYPSFKTAIIAIVISIVIGVAASIIPAKKAAMKNTVDILI